MTLQNTPTNIRERLNSDIHRPRYHYLPPSNWMNDPNGVIQWNSQYHLFYQYNPNGPLWGEIHWGHAVSSDLIHWTDLPIALAPTPGGPDEAGVFSGCAINDNGRPVIFYTGTRGEKNEIQAQCIAFGDDDLLHWEKYADNPVLNEVPAESGQTSDFRDPFVWRENDAWYMVIGSRIRDVGGAVFLYRSHNLLDWEYLHPLLTGEAERNGVIWECPNFFKVGDAWVLIVSSHLGNATGTVIYFVGSYQDHHFSPVYEGVLDYGTFYAPLTMLDDQGRRIMYGWLRETRTAREQERAGWSGVQSIPRELALDEHRRLLMRPVPELEAIRGQHHDLNSLTIDQSTLSVRGLTLDIIAEFTLASGESCGLSLAASGDDKDHVDIEYQPADQKLVVRKISHEMGEAVVTHLREVPHVLDQDESLKLRILLDGSVIEMIANERTGLTSRIYPTNPDNDYIRLIGAPAQLRRLDIWEMPSVWQ
jgi:beta-fructofuranosidase